jgi:hypothetical protein
VLVKAAVAVDTDPTDGGIYNASLAFGSGTEIGTGNYAVYTGTGNSATITGLTRGTTYFVKVYTFNVNVDGSQNYLITSPASGSILNLPYQNTFTFNSTTDGYTTSSRFTTPVRTTESSNGVLSVTPASNMNNLRGIVTLSSSFAKVDATNKFAHITLKNTSSFDKLEIGSLNGTVNTTTYYPAAQTLKSGDTGYTTYDFDLSTWAAVGQFPSIAFSRTTTWSVSTTYANGDIVVDGQTFYQKVGSVDIVTNPRANVSGDWTIVNGDAVAGYPQTGAVGNAITTLPIYIDSIVFDNVPPTIVSNGTGGGTWGTAATWAGGIVPTSGANVTIVSGDTVNSTATRTINQITINSGGTLSVGSTSILTVTTALVNNGALTIANNSNLVQPTGSTYSGSGSATVTRNSNPLLRLDYTMWSSPVSGTQTLEQFSPNTSRVPNRFYTYDALNNVYANIATTSNFSAGSGYLIRMPNDADAVTPTAFAGVFTGTSLNNGNISLTGLTADKFYLVGNPYASTIGADAFLSVNSTAGTLYFWRKTNGALGSAYATYTLTGGTGTTAGSAALEPNGTIQVGQGFIVKTADTSLNFTNAMRLGTASTQFFKTRNVTEKSRVWLNLTNTAGLFSQALVGYLDGATQGVDNVYDGKYINDSATALTSIIEGGEYTIQGRPAFDATDVVALGFKTDVAGDFTIAMDHKDGVFAAAQDIYLVDSKTGIETDLNASSYTFAADAGVDNTRFSLKYQKTLKVGTPTFDENTVNVYKNNGTIYVNSAAKTIKTIEVYDVQGRLIAKQMNVKANTAAISNLKAVRQMLLVKVSADDNSVVTKKILN